MILPPVSKLDQIRSLLEKVTPGPWEFAGSDEQEPDPNESECTAPGKGVIQSWDYEGYSSGLYVREADACFIARSRTLVPSLIAAFDAIKAKVDSQAEDEGLWFHPETGPEAYLQGQLRELHAVIEGAIQQVDGEKGERQRY